MVRVRLATVAFTLAFGIGRVQAQTGSVEKITIQFHTIDDDKNNNTKLWTYLKAGDDTIAEKKGYADSTQFKAPGDTAEFDLITVKSGGLTAADLAKFRVTIQSQARGGAGYDNWEFRYTVTIYLKDGTKIRKRQTTQQKLTSRGESKVEVFADFDLAEVVVERSVPDPDKDEILIFQAALKTLQVVEKIDIPDRVYLKKSAMDNKYQYYLTDKTGKISKPEEILLAGTVIPGDKLGGSRGRFYVLNGKGVWKKAEGPEVVLYETDDKRRKQTVETPGRYVPDSAPR